MNLEEKILNKIQAENLKPKSIWYFLIKDYSLWLAVLFSIILAAISIAPIIFIFSNLELDFIKHINNNFYFFILKILPYPWIFLCLLTTFLATKAWSKTKHGYKFQGEYVVIIAILASLILGIILNLFTFGKIIDNEIENRRVGFGYYKSVEGRRQENWFNVKEGRLIGKVINISTNTISTFELFNEKNNYREIISYDETVPGQEFVLENNSIRVIGYENPDKIFFACAIFPNEFANKIIPMQMQNLENREIRKENIKKQIQTRFEKNPECKEMFDKGRANFIFLKQK